MTMDNAKARMEIGYTRRITGIWRSIVTILGITLIIVASVILSEDIGEYARQGLELAVCRVLPTALPFMIISGLVSSIIHPEDIPLVSRTIERIFSISASGASAVIIGNLAGFPIGGRMTSEVYRDQKITRDDAERLLAYSSNPSPSFVIGAVGSAMLGDVGLGIILLISIMTGTVLSAQLFRGKCRNMTTIGDINCRKCDFVALVKSSADASVSMIAFITVFFTGSKILAGWLKNSTLSALVILLSEVTGAVSFVCTQGGISLELKMGLAAFALGFGGVSVMLQTAAFSSDAGLSLKKYFLIKLSEGIFSAFTAALITHLIYRSAPLM